MTKFLVVITFKKILMDSLALNTMVMQVMISLILEISTIIIMLMQEMVMIRSLVDNI